MFIYVSVSLSTGSGGVCLLLPTGGGQSAYWGGLPTWVGVCLLRGLPTSAYWEGGSLPITGGGGSGY